MPPRYGHTNLIARDWRALVQFYQTVFGCTVASAERDLSGPNVDALTGLPSARITGVHLRLPGWGDTGPTLEIFQFDTLAAAVPAALNRPGFGHICFAVDDVAATLAAVRSAGGGALGELVTLNTSNGDVTLVYATDPEGNIVEIQAWA